MTIVTAFGNNQEIPELYTCRGRNISPPLLFKEIPEGTQSFVLVFEDMDADPAPWIHWLVFNIPVNTLRVSEGRIPAGGTEGLANNRTFGYEGPCSKYFKGTHRYELSLYALDMWLPLPAAVEKGDVITAMSDYILAHAALTGLCTAPDSPGGRSA